MSNPSAKYLSNREYLTAVITSYMPPFPKARAHAAAVLDHIITSDEHEYELFPHPYSEDHLIRRLTSILNDGLAYGKWPWNKE